MGYKEETKKAYDHYAWKFDLRFDTAFNDFVIHEAELFVDNLNGKRVLDLGCGGGIHSQYFRERGLSVLGVDNSERMVELCREKGIEARVGDIEALDIGERFDGVWAYCSLLHLPKEKIRKVILDIKNLLMKDGIFGLAMKAGEGSEMQEHSAFPNVKRFFVFYTDEELRRLLSEDFEMVESSQNAMKSNTFLNYLLRLK